jgi:hypothetical protein
MHRSLATLIVLASLLTGCTPTTPQPTASPRQPPPQIATARQNNESLRAEILSALAAAYPQVVWTDSAQKGGLGSPGDGSCTLSMRNAATDADFYTATNKLLALPAVLDPVVLKHGYSHLGTPTAAKYGGDLYVEATDPTGWRVELSSRGKGGILRISGPVFCSEATPA